MEIEQLLNTTPDRTPSASLGCKVCSRVFDGLNPKRTLARHLRSVHENKTACRFCSKKIKILGRPDHYKCHLKRCPIFIRITNDLSPVERTSLLEKSTKEIRVVK